MYFKASIFSAKVSIFSSSLAMVAWVVSAGRSRIAWIGTAPLYGGASIGTLESLLLLAARCGGGTLLIVLGGGAGGTCGP